MNIEEKRKKNTEGAIKVCAILVNIPTLTAISLAFQKSNQCKQKKKAAPLKDNIEMLDRIIAKLL